MPNVWTIHANGLTGGNDKSNLVGCHINTNASGTAYEFTQPNINNVLSTTSGTSLPTPPFRFPSFSYAGYTWTIDVNSLTAGAGNNEAQGNWSDNNPSISDDETGTWTAQAGTTADQDQDEGADTDEDATAASA